MIILDRTGFGWLIRFRKEYLCGAIGEEYVPG
jgi:hypothetical protein